MNWIVIKAALMSAPCTLFLLELVILHFTIRPRGMKLLAIVAFGLVAANKFVAFSVFGGDAFNPELPLWIIVLWGFLESIVWVSFLVMLVALLFAWAVRPFRRLAFGSVFGVSVVLAFYGMYEGLRVPSVVEHEVVIEDLPAEFDGYRLVHLSDLHCSSAARRDKIAAIVERTNAAQPDLIAITGDLVDGLPAQRSADLEPLKYLKARDGVVACTGNHEKYIGFAHWKPYYERWGVRFLRNDWIDIVRGGARLLVGGLDDRSIGVDSRAVFRGAPTNSCRILLQHQPKNLRRNERELGVRLQLSGHTHGGAMPIISRFVALNNEGHVRGFYREGRILLHVSSGSGQWAGFPLRFFNPPEIKVLVLRIRQF